MSIITDISPFYVTDMRYHLQLNFSTIPIEAPGPHPHHAGR